MNVITTTLNKEQADALFDSEAILFGENNAIPEYRIVEIFGEWAGAFFEKHVMSDGYFSGGWDYNGWGDCGVERPMLHHLYRRGFFKIVSEHNYRLTLQAHRSSNSGKVVDALWQARREAMESAEREEDCKREERKAKRAAARKAKQEEQGAQV